MSTRILNDATERMACLYDSVTGVAFGPVVSDGIEDDSPDILAAFQYSVERSTGKDIRTINARALELMWGTWAAEHSDTTRGITLTDEERNKVLAL